MQNLGYKHQKGAALLMIVAAIILLSAVVAYQMYASNTATIKKEQARDVNSLLLQARDNLLVFSTMTPEIYNSVTKSPGFLPCPDMRELTHIDSGSPGASCSWAGGTNFGRLPQENKGADYFFFSPSEKDSGVSLWYALSDPLRYGVVSKNPVYEYDTSKVSVTLDNLATEPLAAIIIAAGKPLSNQNGRNENKVASEQLSQFVEAMTTLNVNSGKFFTLNSLPTGTAYNDKVMPIKLSDFQAIIRANVCMRADAGNWCNPTTYSSIPSTNWFKAFKWSDSNGNGTGAARICNIKSVFLSKQVDGLNSNECPQ